MGSKASAPAPRNIGDEFNQTLNAEIGTQPQILGALQQYSPQYTQLNTDLLGQALGGQLGLAGQYGGQYVNQQNQLNQQSIAGNPLLAGLQSTALNQLNQGGNLSPEEQLAANEATNGQYASRGTFGSNANLFNQVLNRGNLSQQRLQQNIGSASGIQGLLSGNNGSALLQQLVGGASGQVAQPNINPQSSYAGDLYNTNYNAAQNAYISSQNNRAGLLGGLIKGVGSIGLGLATGGAGFGALGGFGASPYPGGMAAYLNH